MSADIRTPAEAARRLTVVAWTENAAAILEGATWRADLGEQPPICTVQRPVAAVWLNAASPTEQRRALDFIQREHPETGRAYFLPLGHPDPIKAAKAALAADLKLPTIITL